jgi:hypothetical protein
MEDRWKRRKWGESKMKNGEGGKNEGQPSKKSTTHLLGKFSILDRRFCNFKLSDSFMP